MSVKIRLTSEAMNRINHPKNYHIRAGMTKPMCSAYSTVWLSLKENKWNGNLTKEAVIQYLEEKLEMTRNQLLEVVDE